MTSTLLDYLVIYSKDKIKKLKKKRIIFLSIKVCYVMMQKWGSDHLALVCELAFDDDENDS